MTVKMTHILKKIANLLSIFGLNIRKLISLIYFPKFLMEYLKFSIYTKKLHKINPILTDYYDTAGNVKGHYFHQDLFVSQLIFNDNPLNHLDVASRIDGFVAHVASFRKIEVADIRDLDHKIDNIQFTKIDFMSNFSDIKKYESISCLHAIEHFGLGRYNDQIDLNGHLKGFFNITNLLEKEGKLYISFPISNYPRIEFNAHRVFHPNDIFNWNGCEKLKLLRFDYVNDEGDLIKNTNTNDVINMSYACGIYTFIKIEK